MSYLVFIVTTQESASHIYAFTPKGLVDAAFESPWNIIRPSSTQ